MHKLSVALVGLVFVAPGFISACASDSDEPPRASAGSAGTAGSPQGGSSTQGGSSSQGGKSPSAGNSAGGHAGSSSGGSNTGGTAGSGGTFQAEAGGPGSEAGAGGGGADSGGELVNDCLDAPVIDEVKTEALHFTGPGLELGIVRRADPDSVGTSGTTPWLPERFALERGAVAECISALTDLDYVGSHHNFDDEMTATVGADTWIFKQMRDDYDMPTTWTVEARSGNTLLWGPLALALVSCTRLDTPGSCADQYQ
jgi:hypothetical protein